MTDWAGTLVNAGFVLVGALITAGTSWWVTNLQMRAQDQRERRLRRQEWINSLEDRISNIIETCVWFYLTDMKGPQSTPDMESWNDDQNNNTLKLTRLITQVELMLNSKNANHAALTCQLRDLRMVSFSGNQRMAEFESAVEKLRDITSTVLHQESEPLNNMN